MLNNIILDDYYTSKGKVKEYKVEICNRKIIEDFIEKWHYSKNINGLNSNYCFALYDINYNIIGAIIYGKISMYNVWKKYVENENDIIELKRLCCIDNTPRNTESYFIGKTIKYLKNNTNIKKIISYADNEYNHKGIVYKATNFKFIGETKKGRIIIYNDKKYHDKAIRTKYKDELKPYAKKIKEALSIGEAYYKETKTKNIYILNLRDK